MKKLVGSLFLFPTALFGDIKENILEKQLALEHASSVSEESQVLLDLALIYCRDQETDKAFSHFLQALKKVPKSTLNVIIEPDEAFYYNQALQEYIKHSGTDPVALAKHLLENYGDLAERKPHYLHLNFLMATAYANLGEYEEFFSRFYRSFAFLHDSFLAYKIQGILYLRLSHHGKDFKERSSLQNEALYYLNLALKHNPQDAGLYKVLIFLAKDEQNEERIRSFLKQIVKNGVPLPRGDVYLYVKEAVSLKEFKLGQEMIDQARSHYEYSRAILAAQEYLNQQYRG